MKTNRWPISGSERGFSLLEAMVVLIIIAIMATIAIPTYSRMLPNMRLRSAANDLYSNLQAAKMEAIKSNGTSNVTFYPAGGKYVGVNGKTVNLDETYKNSVTYEQPGGGSSVTFAGSPYPKVTFTARGMANAGTVYFKNTNDKYYKVDVLASGVIQIKKRVGTDWE